MKSIIVLISLLIGGELLLTGMKLILSEESIKEKNKKNSFFWKYFGWGWWAEQYSKLGKEKSAISTIRWGIMPFWIIIGLFIVLNGLCYFFPDVGYCSTNFFQAISW